MAEYYAVLKKAIGGLDGGAAEGRRTVYDKARNALIGQLKAVDPPLTTAEISRQRLELEEAIRKVEREAASAASSPPASRPANPPSALPLARNEVVPASAPSPIPVSAEAPSDGPSPQDVFRRAIQDAEQRGSAAGSVERAPVPQYRPEPSYGANAEMRAPRAERNIPLAPPPTPPPRNDLPVRRSEPEYRPALDYDAAPRPGNEPRLAPDYGQDWDAPPLPPNTPPPSPIKTAAPFVDSRDRPPAFTKQRKRGYLEEDDRQLYERSAKARRSRLPSILLLILILAVLGGLGALGWSNRDKLADLLNSFSSSTPTAEAPAAPAAEPVADASGKDPGRLLEPGAEPAPAPSDVRVVDPQAPAVTSDDTAEPAPVEDSAAPADVTDNPAVAVPAAPAVTPAPATGDALVAQKAILYEEPVDAAVAAGGVTAINAAVTWRFIENGPNGPEVEASLLVPERGMKIRFSVHKNADTTLPASHLIEVVVDTPADFPGKGIKSVPRLVLKPTEESRGQPLVGAPAKVTDGFFWIALSANGADVTSNLSLLRDRNWIDLPFVYNTGQRAILTFEKGTPGDRVFQKAFDAWGVE